MLTWRRSPIARQRRGVAGAKMDRRTKILIGLLLVALLAVAGGLWQRFQPGAGVAAPVTAAQTYRVLTSGIVEANEEHRAVINEAMQIPKEIESAQEQSRAMRPPIVNPQPEVAVVPPPQRQPDVVLPEVPPSKQVLIGFSGGVVGETDPCG